jgi:hypothetical protein
MTMTSLLFSVMRPQWADTHGDNQTEPRLAPIGPP